MFITKHKYWVLFCTILYVTVECSDISKSIPFITDYMKWRKIRQLVFLDKAKQQAAVKFVKENLNVFIAKNIFFTFHTSVKYSEATFNRTKEKTVVVTFIRKNFSSQELLDQANRIGHYGEKASWLVLANCHFQLGVMDILRYADFGLNSDIVVTVDPHLSNVSSQNVSTNTPDWQTLFFQQQTFLPFQNTGNQTMNSTVDNAHSVTNCQESYLLYQVYKVRRNSNTSLVVHSLGSWDVVNSTKNLKAFLDYDNRRNFYKYPLIFGIHDTTAEGSIKESEIDPIKTHFANYFARFLNSSKSFVSFINIGHRENGIWTDLLNAVQEEEVDLSAEGIGKTMDRYNDFVFSYTILRTTRNIYIEPEKSEEMRDIFLVPFDSRLFICVISTCLILSIVITFNNFVDSRFCTKDIQKKDKSLIESMVWCVGVFSQQGSMWNTRCYSEKIIVLVSLMFTLIIYNSYAAFITSVLSVELSEIRSVSDLLESDYKIGYAKDSQDEDYLRSVNISELKQIYLRGYLQNDISNITEGLLKVIKGDYGFFASGQAARMEIWNMTKSKCKFDIDEIKIQYTVEYSGIVMSKRSPYRRLINLSLIKMYETGVYRHIYAIIYPNLLKCEKPKTYQSARLADLSTAFFCLLLGWGTSFTILISECLWQKRVRIYRNLKRRFTGENDFNGIRGQGDYDRSFYTVPPAYRSTLILPPNEKNKYFDYVN